MSTEILVIEDNVILRDEIVDFLARRGRTVICCESIAEADEVCQQGLKPQLILSDINLPDGDGVSFCARMADSLPGTKWVLMSGNRELVRYGTLARLPSVQVVDKPVPLAVLARFIGALDASPA
jgi:CheY-like chemotaxis protein